MEFNWPREKRRAGAIRLREISLREVQGEAEIETGEPHIVQSTFREMEGRAGRTK